MIVVGGEALVDLVPAPETAEGEIGALIPRLGGGPYNVAIALGRLEVPCSFLGRLSMDQFGDAQFARLVAANVDDSMLRRDDRPTMLAVVGLGADGSARYSFHVADTAARFVDDPGGLPDQVAAVCLGTLGMVLEPGASTYEAVLFDAARQGKFVALDPNIRGDLITDPEAYRKRFASWLPAVDLLKLSVDDASWLVGDKVDPVIAGREWLQQGVSTVVLTDGRDGLTALTPSRPPVHVPAAEVDVVDTIGAGDTILAALLAWLHQHDALASSALPELDWQRPLTHASAAAAITCGRTGAEPPYLAELPR